MDERSIAEKRQVRRAFNRAAGTYDQAAVLQREVCGRMLSRLDYIRHQPAAILDAGSGTGFGARRLAQRFPGATVVALDVAHAMLMRCRNGEPWWKRLLRRPERVLTVCGDVDALPVAGGWAGMVWSNLMLQWCGDLSRTFAEVHRTLAPGGLFMFSTFGPDTLRELRAAFRAADGYTHVNRFIDMHDIGDMLVQAGFATPVTDMEFFTLTYAEPVAAMRDLKALGAHNVTAGRSRGLTGRAGWGRALARLEATRREGRLPVTFEVVYGHAWKAEPRRGPGGQPVIEIKPAGPR